jgi:hypothetical protein
MNETLKKEIFQREFFSHIISGLSYPLPDQAIHLNMPTDFLAEYRAKYDDLIYEASQRVVWDYKLNDIDYRNMRDKLNISSVEVNQVRQDQEEHIMEMKFIVDEIIEETVMIGKISQFNIF